jgi:hypothetical protein
MEYVLNFVLLKKNHIHLAPNDLLKTNQLKIIPGFQKFVEFSFKFKQGK